MHQIPNMFRNILKKTVKRGSLSVCLKGERRGEGRNTGLGLKGRLHEEGEKPSRTKAEGPPPNSRLTFRVRYLTQLHSFLPAPHLSFLPPPFLSLRTHPPTTLSPSFLSALFPLTFAPQACLIVPIPEISKEKIKKIEGGGWGVGVAERIRRGLTQTRGVGPGGRWGGALSLYCSCCRFRVCARQKTGSGETTTPQV